MAKSTQCMSIRCEIVLPLRYHLDLYVLDNRIMSGTIETGLVRNRPANTAMVAKDVARLLQS